MAIHWHVNIDRCTPEEQRFLESFDNAFNEEGELLTLDKISQVRKLHLGSRSLFIKRYTKADRLDRTLVSQARLQGEWDNLLLFRRLGIATPEPIAFGIERRNGLFQRGVMITAEVEQAMDLYAVLRTTPERFHDRTWFRTVANDIADFTRLLHEHRFAHNDLKWRNILLAGEQLDDVYFFDCPKGRRWTWPFLNFRIIKDLGHLDLIARRVLSRSQRLYWFKRYRRSERLTAADKAMIRKILLRQGREGRELDAK